MKVCKNPFMRLSLPLIVLSSVFYCAANQVLAQQVQIVEKPATPLAQDKEIGGAYSGDINNGIEDLNKIYKYINIYRLRHDGQYPMQMGPLSSDMVRSPKSYGMQKMEEVIATLTNPDARYADNPSYRRYPDFHIPYGIYGRRWDGSPTGSPKVVGTRDVLADTDLYFHLRNEKDSSGHSKTIVSGCYLILWDDGEVEKVPFDKIIYVPDGKEFAVAYPGQAGLPWNCISYEEYWLIIGKLKSLPISK